MGVVMPEETITPTVEVEIPAERVKTASADSRGRVTLGSEYADETVTVAILSVESNNQKELHDYEE